MKSASQKNNKNINFLTIYGFFLGLDIYKTKQGKMKKLITAMFLAVSGWLCGQNVAVVQQFTPGEGSLALPGMGFGGEVIAKFQNPVANLAGKDVYISESSCWPARRWPERARVYFSQDGCNWVFAEEITQSDSVEIRSFNKIEWIRIIDSSKPNFDWSLESNPDGFDLISITADNFAPGGFSTPMVPKYPRFVTFAQGLKKDGTPVEAARSNAFNSLHQPQGNDQGYNFFSLGMGGWAIYSFEFAIFDEPGYDLTVVETSWGSPSCGRWPERAMVEASYNIEGPYFYIGELCLDGSLDLEGTGMNGFHYVRITDRTPSTGFSADADGYDVDGLIAIHQCSLNQSAKEIEDQQKEPDHYVIKNFYGVTVKESQGEVKTEGLKPGAYVVEFNNSGVKGRKMIVVQP